MVRVIGMQTGELEVGLREAGTRRVVIINVVEAVRIGSSEGVEKKGEEGEAWDFADSSLFQVDGSVRVLSEVRATRRNDAVSIGQADGAEVNEVGDQRLRDDVVYSKTSLEDANEESLVICCSVSLDLCTDHTVHEENPVVQVSQCRVPILSQKSKGLLELRWFGTSLQ